MKLRWLLLLALSFYGLALAGMAIAPRQAAGETARSTAPAAAPLMIGFALNFHHTEQVDLYLRAIDQVAQMGFNTIEILTPTFQTDGAAEHIHVIVAPGRSPRREDLVRVLRYAHQRGLTTVLMPLVLFENPRGNEWRGKIQPERWDAWWASYRKNMDYFLDIANEADVSVFSVGSELLSTEKQTDRWESFIKYGRKRFKGRLSYSTNWDHYQTPAFWNRLDMIGISCYWDMTKLAKNDPPEPEALAERWKQIRQQVLDFAAAQGKPAFLTEIGYPSLPWGLKDPWNYVNTKDALSTPQVQEQGYKAFLKAWEDLLIRKPDPAQFTGVCFYEWDVYQSGGPNDTGYGIRGKPTYDLLKNWLQDQVAQAK